ncbi:ABC transporter ATP-binding protein [Microbacterium album]|uniref:ABC transporter n=1 Tax=Microbacterium album TaxID=2053191 RepID=A0A917IFN3_9MICO|nr:ABC transporter ATP-binding protein [Microbacterium album]GGH45672.1 ABC transporter [Microbacterium album]
MTDTPGAAPHAPTVPAVELSGVGRTFETRGQRRRVLRDVSLRIPARSIVAIIGASGSGKSTLLRLIGGLGKPSDGTVSIDGTPVVAYDRRCAFAFQEPRLLPWRTVERNVAYGLPRSQDREAGARRVRELLGLVGLADFAGHRPRQISGGMAQRTSLARALARTPRVLLLDEPFGALDALTRLRMHDLLLDVHAAEPTTVVFVTHDVDEALVLADTIVVLGHDESSDEPGATILRTVSPEQPRPRDHAHPEFVALRHELLAALGVHLHSEI